MRGCTAVFGSSYLTDCEAELGAAAESCEAEMDAMLSCASTAFALDYECDAGGDVVFAPGVCSAETTALQKCSG